MNTPNTTFSSDVPPELTVVPKPTVSRDDMQNAVVDLLWAQAHVTSRVYGRTPTQGLPASQRAPSALELMAERQIDGLGSAALDSPARELGITWADVASTQLAQTMEQLYDFAYFAVFDLRYYPHELGDETGAWWIALFLKDMASSDSLLWQREYNRATELSAAHTLLQIVETANARNLLEGAAETFIQGSQVGYLTIRQLALISDFTEESLRVLANPKRNNALPTQSVTSKTVVGVEDARRWLQSKGRYTAVTAKPDSGGSLNLALARFESPASLCDALSEHVGAIATRGAASLPALTAVRSLYPKAYWQRTGIDGKMVDTGLALMPSDLQDAARLRELAVALGLDADLLTLRTRESVLRESLTGLEAQIRTQAERR